MTQATLSRSSTKDKAKAKAEIREIFYKLNPSCQDYVERYLSNPNPTDGERGIFSFYIRNNLSQTLDRCRCGHAPPINSDNLHSHSRYTDMECDCFVSPKYYEILCDGQGLIYPA